MKLTRYISLRFIGVSTFVILISIPVFFFVLKKIMQDNIDESLQFQKIWVINQKDKIDFEKLPNFDQNISISEVNEILRDEDRLKTKNLYVPEDQEFVNHRFLEFYTKKNNKIYLVKIKRSLIESEDILNTIIALQLTLVGLLFLTLIIIDKNIEKNIWKPFYKMLDSLQQFRLDKEVPLIFQKTNIKELDDLNSSINDLVSRNKTLYKAQKEFTENASHELQTPIAVIQTKLEMMYQTEPISEEQAKYLQEIYAANSKMGKLNKTLLLLAKIENHYFDDVETIDIRKNIDKVSEDYLHLLELKNIHFSSDLEVDKKVIADENLIQILFGNLISNAIKYCNENGEIQLFLDDKKFRISNTSNHQQLNSELLFQRFQKQNTGNESNGLGLEICKKICEIYGWKIQYHYVENKHEFEILF